MNCARYNPPILLIYTLRKSLHVQATLTTWLPSTASTVYQMIPHMKMLLLISICLAALLPATAQLKVKGNCPEFEVDILDGKVNGIRPDFTPERIKALIPCFTSSTGEGDTSKCGTTVFYKDRDLYFYTGRDYVQIGPNFKGKLSLPLMGAQRKTLFNWFGLPKLKDDTWEAYQTAYGCL